MDTPDGVCSTLQGRHDSYAMRRTCDCVTVNSATAMGLDDCGIAEGRRADCVLLQARDPIEAIRPKATRLAVIRSGRVIAETPARVATLSLNCRPATADGAEYAPVAAG